MQIFSSKPSIRNATFLQLFIKRCFCLTNIEQNKSARREGRFLAKAMKTGIPKKKKYWILPESGGGVSDAHIAKSSGGVGNPKRVAVLNKLFMKNITSLMATGEVSCEFRGKGIEISRVKVVPDFTQVNVYWCAKGNESDLAVESTLNATAGQLRHELSQLRVMGVVPKIQFVKDNSQSRIAEVERLLRTADFGEDYMPVDAKSLLHSELSADYPKTDERVLNKVLTEEEREQLQDYEGLPVMRMDVLGLDYSAIMDKIKRSMKKSQAQHRTEDTIVVEANITSSVHEENAFEYLSSKQRHQELNKFLTNRKAMQNKARKKDRQLEIEMYEDELSNSYMDNEPLEYDSEEADFIEEDYR